MVQYGILFIALGLGMEYVHVASIIVDRMRSLASGRVVSRDRVYIKKSEYQSINLCQLVKCENSRVEDIYLH